jgi:hypothetical protein
VVTVEDEEDEEDKDPKDQAGFLGQVDIKFL